MSPIELLTEDDVRQIIRDHAGASVAAWARENGFTQSYVSKVLRNEIHVSDALAKTVGMAKKVYFSPCNDELPGA